MAEVILNGIPYREQLRHREPGDIPTHRMLRLIRKMNGITQIEAATQIGVCAATLYHWERGRPMPFEAAVKLCRLYGVSVEMLAVTVDNPGWGDFRG